MADSTTDTAKVREQVEKMALAGMPITRISKELGISWSEARSYVPISSWRGAKVKLTNRLKKLETETDQKKRKELTEAADKYADFLYDAAKHLRGQVDAARRALNR